MNTAELEREMRQAIDRQQWAKVQRLGAVLDQYDAPQDAPLPGAALWYAEQGLQVFPLQPGTKVPMPGSRGCKDATSDTDQVHSWWRARPTANIGLATGHLVDVVDFDGALGHESWAKLWADRPGDGLVPDSDLLATVTTPRPGGLHAYVRATGHGSNGAALVPGVDYRSRGGYVVAPPSRLDHRPGQQPGTYRFLRPLLPGWAAHD